MSKIGIIGGGAAGYFAAILLGEKGQKDITLIEKNSEPLGKVKISGGGRCNVTHHLFDPTLLSEKYPRGSKELKYAFEKFQPKDMIEWLEKKSVSLKTESDGRMFPISNSSSTIIDCFQKEAKNLGILVLLNTNIESINLTEAKNFLVKTIDKEFQFDKLLIATGSNKRIWSMLETLGHTIEDVVPSLFTFNIENENLTSLTGLSVPNAEVKIYPKGKSQLGPVLITHWGLSGPAVLRLSAWEAKEFSKENYNLKIKINWLGKISSEEFQNLLLKTKKDFSTKKIYSVSFDFPSRLWNYFLELSKVDSEKQWSSISNSEIHSLKETITNQILNVTGKGVFKEEFVTCGGIKRKEINFNTMESKIIPGLYFAGEVIDVDGITGGFNFQNAWTTAYLASEAMSVEYYSTSLDLHKYLKSESLIKFEL